MGLFDKVKNMFTEEVDEPVTKEPVVVAPTVEETQKEKEEVDVQAPKKEERSMPIFFDDNDFDILEQPKRELKKTSQEEKYYTKKETTEKKSFKLSPVISPVYGVLDKNYHKEDITPKRQAPKTNYYEKDNITIDDVRKKAYGTLEDDLETSLIMNEEKNTKEVIGSRMQRKYKNDILLEDLMDPNYKPASPEAEKDLYALPKESRTIEPIALDDFLDDDDRDEVDYKDPNEDTLTESDLFHLIDSMYDKEEEE